MPEPYSYAGKYPAQNERCGIYGISESEKRSDDLSLIHISETANSGVKDSSHGGKEHDSDKRIHSKPVEEGSGRRTMNHIRSAHLRAAGNKCMAGRPILKRACAQPAVSEPNA